MDMETKAAQVCAMWDAAGIIANKVEAMHVLRAIIGKGKPDRVRRMFLN